jgi:hypothetical protein
VDLRGHHDRVTEVEDAIERIVAWGEARDWLGYDPYDGLNSPLARVLRGRAAKRVLTQAVKLSPVNLRPPLGIKPAWNQKAIGLVASAYARLGRAAEAVRWLEWLARNHLGGEDGAAWGYHFPVQTRVFSYPRDCPNTIATSFVAQAFLDGCELVDGGRAERFAGIARASATYLVTRMLAERGNTAYFRYLPGREETIHNANMLACAVLARTAQVLTEDHWLEPARRALKTTLNAQRDDGSWPYAEGPHGWVDNFHTAYVLESLARFPEAGEELERGLRYWERELFLEDGTPKYFPHRVFPLDAHCYAQAIETWLAVDELDRAERVAQLLIRQMLAPSGYVYFQRHRAWTSKVPLVRWSTAPAFRALAGLLMRRGDVGTSRGGRGDPGLD